jgi:hypothetical protein
MNRWERQEKKLFWLMIGVAGVILLALLGRLFH